MTEARFHMAAGAPAPVAPYSHAVEAGGWLFVTGQLPIDADDEGAALPDGIEAQTAKVLDNLEAVLAAAGSSLAQVVAARVYLTRFERDFEAMNRVYAGRFAPERRPARTCVGVTHLARGALVEIDLIAHPTTLSGG